MRVAVTGASGLIGSALCASLARDGHEVVRVTRSGDGGTDIVRWDIDAGTIDRAGLERVDAVVNLAGEGIGEKRWTAEQKQRIMDSRVKGTTLLADTLAGLDRKPKVLVNGSAIGYYGDCGDDVLDEHSGAGTLFLSKVCGAWESAAEPAAAAGIRVALARTGIVLAPKGGALKPLLRLFRLGLGGRVGNGRQWMSWVAIDDEVGALRFLIDNEISGPANIVGPAPVTNAEFTRVLAHAVHRPAFVPVPRFAPSLLLGRELAGELLFASQRVEPAVLEAAGYTFRYPTLAAALAAMFG